MIFNVSGGGGAALNFKVVAYATEEERLAATPSKNTIGIITSTPITSWIFSATQPSNADAGMVWIKTGTASSVGFNALKKNDLHVYPIAAYQYVSGVFTSRKLYSYAVDGWKNPDFYIIKNGRFANGLSLAKYSANYAVQEVNGAIRILPAGDGSHVSYLSNAIDVSNYSELVLETLGGATYYALEIGFNATKTGRPNKYGGTFATQISFGKSAKLTISAGTYSVNVPAGSQNVWIGISGEETTGQKDATYLSCGIDIANLYLR